MQNGTWYNKTIWFHKDYFNKGWLNVYDRMNTSGPDGTSSVGRRTLTSTSYIDALASLSQ